MSAVSEPIRDLLRETLGVWEAQFDGNDDADVTVPAIKCRPEIIMGFRPVARLGMIGPKPAKDRSMSSQSPPNADKSAYHRIVDAEVAMEVINSVRTKLMARVYELELDNPAEADRLSAKEGDMYRILRSIHFDKPDHNAALVAHWALLLKDDAKFWASFDG